MNSRQPVVAGQFYPGDSRSCLQEASECVCDAQFEAELPATIVAGIVPHAGWFFSGSLAAMVFCAVKQRCEHVDTFVIFGAAHSYMGPEPAVYPRGTWLTPLGDVAVDNEFACALLAAEVAVNDCRAHAREHSIEVQVPFVRHLFGDAAIVPVVVPPSRSALSLGRVTGELIAESDKKIVCIGSTDLTHYGPRYGFAPMGVGQQAHEWASKVNDGEFIDLALKLDAAALLTSSAEKCNCCGAGAAAATITAAAQLGKTQGTLLAHTNSNEVMKKKMDRTGAESVGYAAIVF